jgi:hypothetical protein
MQIFALREVLEVLVLGIVVSLRRILVKENSFKHVFGGLRAANFAKVKHDREDLILIEVVLACQ